MRASSGCASFMPISNRSSRWIVLTTAALLAAGAGEVRAEIVVLTTGRTLNVRAHRVEGTTVVLELRTGGEVVCDVQLVARVDPDEVPWPEPDAPAQTREDAGPLPPAAGMTGFPFDDLIGPLSHRHGVEVSLVRAVIATESAFEPRARS